MTRHPVDSTMSDNQLGDKANQRPSQHRSTAAAGTGNRQPFGVSGLAKSPKDVIQNLIDSRGLSPHQVKLSLEGRETELVVGPYVIEKPLGSGPWGECSLALQIRSGDHVILRQFPISLNDGQQQLASELKRAREVRHRAFQRGEEVNRHAGRVLIVHELIPGEDLNRYVIRTGHLSPGQAIDCTIQMAEALREANRLQLIHGELRPSKVIVNPVGEIRIREIATANFVRERRREAENVAAVVSKVPVEHVQCAAPEAYLPATRMDMRADMYSLGCMLVFMLTGKHAFDGPESGGVIVAHRSTRPPSIASRRLKISTQTEKLVLKLLAKSPGDRFGSYDDLLRALGALQKSLGKSDAATRQQWWGKVDQDWVTSNEPAGTETRRIRVSRALSYAGIGMASAAAIAAMVRYGPPLMSGQEQPAAGAAQTDSDAARKFVQPTQRVFREDATREVVTVESEDAFRLP